MRFVTFSNSFLLRVGLLGIKPTVTTTEPLIVADGRHATFGCFSLNRSFVVIWFKLVVTAPAVDSHDVNLI